MAQFSMEIMRLTGSVLRGNQHFRATYMAVKVSSFQSTLRLDWSDRKSDQIEQRPKTLFPIPYRAKKPKADRLPATKISILFAENKRAKKNNSKNSKIQNASCNLYFIKALTKKDIS